MGKVWKIHTRVMTLQGMSSRANTLCFNQLALSLWTGLGLEWMRSCNFLLIIADIGPLLTTSLSFFLNSIFKIIVFLPIRLNPSPLFILTLETLWSISHHPRSLWIKASWLLSHCFCPLLGDQRFIVKTRALLRVKSGTIDNYIRTAGKNCPRQTMSCIDLTCATPARPSSVRRGSEG